MTAFYVRWRDRQTGEPLSQKFDDEADARFLLTVLKAHDSDTDAAHRSAVEFYAETFTVSKMVSEHIALLTGVNGYTLRRYKGNLKNHLTEGLGSADARLVGYAEVSSWVQKMQSKGLSSKTIANVHGLLSAAFNTMVKLKKRQDNPCKGVSLPKSDAIEEISTFLTKDEWGRLSRLINEPHRSLFEFLAMTGLRFSEATALYGRDFSIDPRGRTTVKITRAWTHDENNTPYLGPPKTAQSRRTVVVDRQLAISIGPLLRASAKSGAHVFLNRDGERMDHRAAWHAWDRAVIKAQASGLGKRPRIHDLRHSNASWLLQAGLDLFKLQKHLGHKSINTTINRYSHLLPEGYDDTATAMERAFAS